MATKTKIEWCDHTFNPWRGCTKVSAGCANCYAEAGSKRNPAVLGVWGPNGTRVVASESTWADPFKWAQEALAAGERRRVFCASLADVFEDWRGTIVSVNGNPFWWCQGSLSNSPIPSVGLTEGCRLATMSDIRERLFQLIDDCPHLDWLLVTKRPENVRRMWPGGRRENVWLLTSVEDQAAADLRVPELLSLRDLAPVLGLSAEPLLGPVDLHLFGSMIVNIAHERAGGDYGRSDGKRPNVIDWVIVGGESGPRARPCNVEWIRSIVDQCQTAGVPVFVKQLGALPVGYTCGLPHYAGIDMGSDAPRVARPIRDPKGGDPAEWPEELRVREFPTREEAP